MICNARAHVHTDTPHTHMHTHLRCTTQHHTIYFTRHMISLGQGATNRLTSENRNRFVLFYIGRR